MGKPTLIPLCVLMILAGMVCVGSTYVANAGGPTYVSGEILTNTTWSSADSPFIVTDNVTVRESATLLIEEGTELRFNWWTSLRIEGNISIAGSLASPVILTSNFTLPLPGDWMGIRLSDSMIHRSNTIKHARIEFATWGVRGARSRIEIDATLVLDSLVSGLYADHSEFHISNSEIRDSRDNGVMVFDSNVSMVGTSVQNSSTYGLYAYRSRLSIGESIIDGAIQGIYAAISEVSINETNMRNMQTGVQAEDSCVLEMSNSSFLSMPTITVLRDSTVLVRDSDLEDATQYSLKLYNSTARLVNTSFEEDRIRVSIDSIAYVQNYLWVEATLRDGSPVENLSVVVSDNAISVVSCLTDSNGRCGPYKIVDRVYNGSESPTENTTQVEVFHDQLLFIYNPRDIDMSYSHVESFLETSELPVVEITSPAQHDTVQGLVRIEGIAYPGTSDIQVVSIQIDDGPWISSSPLISGWERWWFDWNSLFSVNGVRMISARATDVSGFHSDIDVLNVTLANPANQPPMIEVATLKDGDVLEGDVTIHGTSSDADGFVFAVQVAIDGGDWTMANRTGPYWSLWEFDLDTEVYSEGSHVIRVRATDNSWAESIVLVSVTFRHSSEGIDLLRVPLVFVWILPLALVAAISLGLAYRRKHKKSVEKNDAGKEPEVVGVGLSSEERLLRLKEALKKGLISREVYESNSVKLGIEESEIPRTSETEETVYVCPECNNEVESYAVKCSNCGALFED